jgi:septum formation protein
MDTERASQAAPFVTNAIRLDALEPLVLASGSPRRREILRSVGWAFEAIAADVDETLRKGEVAEDYVLRLAGEKAGAVAALRPFGLVLGADTVVVIDGDILGKPRDADDARRMLRCLSGRWHEVLTGVSIIRAESGKRLSELARTRVRFAEMSEEEIDWYIATGEPMDKAGAYAIQGHASLFIEAIDGEYWNVVGLPVRLIYELVRKLG